MVCVEIAMRPMRSPRSVAIGASSTGARSTSMPGSATRNVLTQRISGKQPEDLAEGEDDADQQHRDDDAVEARVGHEGVVDLAVEDERDEGGDDQEDDHPPQINLRPGQLVRVVFPRAAIPNRRKG